MEISSIILYLMKKSECNEKSFFHSRKPNIVSHRLVLIKILRALKYSYPEIGLLLKKDHTSILHLDKKAPSVFEIALLNEVLLFFNVKIKQPPIKVKLTGYKGKWTKFFGEYKAVCWICNFDDVIEVHHVIAKKDGGTDSFDNLIVLCPNHHKLLHDGTLIIKRIDRENFRRQPCV